MKNTNLSDGGQMSAIEWTDANPVNREGGPHPQKSRNGGDMAEWPEDLRVREFPR